MDSRESLLGRIDDLHILPLNFGQFALFSSVYAADSSNLEDFQRLLPPPDIRLFDKPGEYFDSLWGNRRELAAYEARMAGVVREYLLAGGYPEYFETKGIAAWQKKLSEDILQRGLYRDVVSVYGVKNPEILERLVYYIAGRGGEYAYASIAGTLGVDVSTVSSYLEYLSQAFLARVCENYSPNVGKVIRKNKKIYILDNGIRNALLRIPELSPTDEGGAVEGCCVNAAQRDAELHGARVFFWREDKKEVDVILDKKKRPAAG
jgi:predicted AAA+ superfamily ATPase